MADISMCLGDNCEKREDCYRFLADADPHWQSYMEPERTDEKCNSFWPAYKPPVVKDSLISPEAAKPSIPQAIPNPNPRRK